jgi:SAM-dependent methyltransferase
MFSPWRQRLYKALESLHLQGEVIDLGGSLSADYHLLPKGSFRVTVANIDPQYGYDVLCDLEKPFPIESMIYDGAICLNVLEHIYDYKLVLSEIKRILKPGSSLILAVPFIIQLHPCPHDHWRYTSETLVRLLTEQGYKDISIVALGNGPATAAYQILFNILKWDFIRLLIAPCANLADWVFLKVRPTYNREIYPLGYLLTARV